MCGAQLNAFTAWNWAAIDTTAAVSCTHVRMRFALFTEPGSLGLVVRLCAGALPLRALLIGQCGRAEGADKAAGGDPGVR